MIMSNPEQSKHLETARMKLRGHWIDLVNLRSEEYAQHSRIPTMTVSLALFAWPGRTGCQLGAPGSAGRLGVGALGGRVAFLHLPPGAARPFPPLFSPAALPPPLHAPGPPFTQQTSTGPADLSAAHQCLSCLRPPPPRPPPRPLQFGTPEEDALRRDFTINSLFYNLNTGAIEDYSRKGLDDLREGIIRTPLPPKETFLDGVCVCVCA